MAKKQATENKYLDKVSSNGGRPKLILNAEGVNMAELLSGFMCTEEEIASAMSVSVDTLHNANNSKAFTEALKRGQEKGKASLRRTQFKLAEKNASMAIWLGKQYLQQKDEVSAEISSMPVIVVDV